MGKLTALPASSSWLGGCKSPPDPTPRRLYGASVCQSSRLVFVFNLCFYVFGVFSVVYFELPVRVQVMWRGIWKYLCHAQHCCPLWAFNEPGPRHQYHVTRDCRVDTHASSGSIVVTGEPYSSDV